MLSRVSRSSATTRDEPHPPFLAGGRHVDLRQAQLKMALSFAARRTLAFPIWVRTTGAAWLK